MKRLFMAVWLSFSAIELFAYRHVGFQTDAFNRAYPASYANNMVFSPVSFEVDCAVIADSLETIPKANVSETMGIVLDFATTYQPIIEAFASRTNGMSVISARGFCVADLKYALPTFRQYLERTYGVEVFQGFPPTGAESWFRATMEGEMENFTVPVGTFRSERYSFYDLVSVSVEWEEPFPTANTREIKFHPSEDDAVSVACMSDVRIADTWENEDYTLLKLPLKGRASFYALLPRSGFDLSTTKQDISSLEIDHLLAVTKSVTELGVAHGPCAIVLPRLELFSRTNFSSVLAYFRIPTKGLVRVTGDRSSRELVQCTRFRLTEHGRNERPVVEKDPAKEIPISPETKKLVFDRPFIFFVYHEDTASVLIAGQFSGR